MAVSHDEAETTGPEETRGAIAAGSGGHSEELREQARRRRHLDELFGDVLPTTTSDERAPGQHGGFSRAHYEASRPPHWGTKQ